LNLQKIRNFTPKTRIDMVLIARKTTTRTHEGKCRKSARLSRSFVGIFDNNLKMDGSLEGLEKTSV